MAQDATGYLWNLPNYSGQLFTADAINTPILSALGGLTGGGLQTENFVFPVTSEYDFPAAAQPERTEVQTLEAPAPVHAVRTQVTNVCQVFDQAVRLTYEKMSNRGRLSGINTVGQTNNIADELAWQINYNLQIIARNVEYTILRGAHQEANNENTANKTRGIGAAVALSGGTRVNADSGALTRAMLQELWREMFDAGAMFMNPVLICGGYQKQAISDIYGYAPESRNVGGLNIQQIETDFGNIGVMPAHRFALSTSILCVDMSLMAPVFQPVPGKGNFFYEPKNQPGAAEGGILYGKFGLDHGPAFALGEIYGLDDGS